MVTQVDLKSNPLARPRTVCTNSKCIKVYDMGNGIKRNKYEQLCHDPCYLKGVTVDRIGHHELSNCEAMDGENCLECHHSYKEHMHIMYESVEVTVEIEDENIKSQMTQKLSVAEAKQIALKGLEDRINAYEQEQKRIEQATARFACFLKNNAITPYNDAILEYMDHQIREEQDKVIAGGDPKIYEGMKTTRNGYKMQFDILEEEIAKGGFGKVLTPKEVGDEVDQLCKLHHFGQKLKDAMNAASSAAFCNVGNYTEVTCSPRTMRHKAISILKLFKNAVGYVADAVKPVISNNPYLPVSKE